MSNLEDDGKGQVGRNLVVAANPAPHGESDSAQATGLRIRKGSGVGKVESERGGELCTGSIRGWKVWWGEGCC